MGEAAADIAVNVRSLELRKSGGNPPKQEGDLRDIFITGEAQGRS